MKRKVYSLLVLIAMVIYFGQGQSNQTQLQKLQIEPTQTYQVLRVIDGDTFEVNYNGKTEKVRLIGVDTPETVKPRMPEQPYGIEASNYSKSQLTGNSVRLEFDVQQRDKYGRLLAYVWLNDKLYNKTLVKEGYAQVATFPPNIKYVEVFIEAQKEAREAKRGLWGK